MGGYYNEPEDDAVTAQNTHMVFGIRCVERTVSLSSTIHATLLQPVVDDTEQAQHHHPAPLSLQDETELALYVLSQDRMMMMMMISSRVAVLEGSGLVSSTLVSAATQSSDLVVLACSADPANLQRIQMAHLMYSSSSARGTLETVHFPDDDFSLPDADVLVVASSMVDDEQQLARWRQRYASVIFMDAGGSVQIMPQQNTNRRQSYAGTNEYLNSLAQHGTTQREGC
eukprot:scaffold6899_cov183-Amphora_coffeaeformis.AAC.24